MKVALVALCLALPLGSFAQNAAPNPEPGQVQVNPDGSSTVKLGSHGDLDGIDIAFDNSGNWSKIYSTYHHPVEFPDRRGIRNAQVIAEEKGKAEIVRFFNQEVQSERLIEEVNSTLGKAVRVEGAGSDNKMTRTTERQMTESIKEFTRSYASGNLRGVTVLETGYDEKKEEVWVKVGISRKTIAIAGQVQKSMNDGSSVTPGGANGQSSGADVKTQPSEVRTGRELPN